MAVTKVTGTPATAVDTINHVLSLLDAYVSKTMEFPGTAQTLYLGDKQRRAFHAIPHSCDPAALQQVVPGDSGPAVSQTVYGVPVVWVRRDDYARLV